MTLSRWLKRATSQGVICRDGSGLRNAPYRYWLPGREPMLYPDDHVSKEELQAWNDRCLVELFSFPEPPK